MVAVAAKKKKVTGDDAGAGAGRGAWATWEARGGDALAVAGPRRRDHQLHDGEGMEMVGSGWPRRWHDGDWRR